MKAPALDALSLKAQPYDDMCAVDRIDGELAGATDTLTLNYFGNDLFPLLGMAR